MTTTARAVATRETASGDDGFFRLLALPVGDYIVTVDAPRFTTTVRELVAVNVSQAVRVDVPLALSSVAETVTVAGGASLVETSNTALGRVVTGRELVDLPNINTPESTCFQAIAPSAFYVFASTFPTNNAVANRLATQAGQFGNAGRNIARGPGYTNVDASLVRTFPLAGRSQVQFRWEVFNVFNEVNLGLPVADLNSPSFGRIFSAGPPRLMQFAVKVLY